MQAIGTNLADVCRRKEIYHRWGNPKFIAGYEGAGIVLDNKNSFKSGDRIAFTDSPFSNAEFVAVPVAQVM